MPSRHGQRPRSRSVRPSRPLTNRVPVMILRRTLGGLGSGCRREGSAISQAGRAHEPDSDRGVPKAGRNRVRGRRETDTATASRSATWRISTRWAFTQVNRSGLPVADTQQQRVPQLERDLDPGDPASRHRGECNIQFALDPKSEDYRIIEVNAAAVIRAGVESDRVSTAFVAAKLALGYGLHELKNSRSPR